jgi:hypothetical protein
MTEKSAVKPKGGPMSVFKQTSPMPLLMGIIVKNSDKLSLSKEQKAVFSAWRAKNMGPSLKIGKEILAEEKAITQAGIAGKSNADIQKMLSAMLKKRQTLASNMLKCRDMIMTTLDKAQWKKLVAIQGE